MLQVLLLLLLLPSFASSSLVNRHPHHAAEDESITTSTPTPNRELIRVGFLYTAATTDFGWNFKVDQSRLALEKLYTRQLVHTFFEISTDEQNLFPAINSLVLVRNCSLIFISVNFSGVAIDPVAKAFPHVHFVLTNGISDQPNVNAFSLRLSECFFPLGSLAARLAASNTKTTAMILGYRNSDTFRAVDGYVAGARVIDPNHQVEIYFNSDRSEITAQKLVQQIAARGIDIIIGIMLNDLTARLATKYGRHTFSFPADIGRNLYGENVLSGCTIDWVNGFSMFIEREWAGIWERNWVYRYGRKEGGLEIAEFSTQVSDDDVSLVTTESKFFLNESFNCIFSNQTMIENDLIGNFVASDFDAEGCLPVNKLMNFSYPFKGIVDKGDIYQEQMIVPIYVQWSEKPTIALIVVVTVSSFIIILSIAMVFVFRKRVIIAVTNEFFCYTILVGSLVGYASLFFWMGEPTRGTCVSRIWFLDISACFIFGSIGAKTYRIWRLWNNPDLRETSRSGRFIFMMILALALIQIVFLSVLTALDGYHVVRVFSQEGLEFDEYFLTCDLTSNGVVLVALILASNGLVIVVCGVLAYVSKNVSQKYNETSSIVLSIYSIMVATTISLLLFVNIKTADPRRQIIFVSTGIYIAVTCPLISIFGPKFKTIITEYSFAASSQLSAKSSTSVNSNLPKGSGKHAND